MTFRRKVDNRKAPKAERQARPFIDKCAVIIGPAMRQTRGHGVNRPLQRRRIHLTFKINKSG